MSDASTNGNGADGQEPQQSGQQQQQVKTRILGQYIRDLSFENVMTQKGVSGEVQPEIQVRVNLDARKRSTENQYEVITKLNVTSQSKDKGETLFVLELEYAGIFEVTGVNDQQLHPYLLIECPRMTFPFVRRIVSDVTRDGGFPPLNLEPIDFVALYRQELARRQQQQQEQQGETPPADA